jgi:hypothetical protein
VLGGRITINVKGDRKQEWQEVFYVNLSGAVGALITSAQGSGVIQTTIGRSVRLMMNGGGARRAARRIDRTTADT